MANSFQFSDSFGDARLAELTFLSCLDREGGFHCTTRVKGPWRDLLLNLVINDFVTTFSYEISKTTGSYRVTAAHQQ